MSEAPEEKTANANTEHNTAHGAVGTPVQNNMPFAKPGETPEQTAAREAKNWRTIRRTKIAVWIIFGLCAIMAAYVYIESLPPPPGTYDALAKCIANTSTTFYGAWWCPHCAEQKTEFGDAAQYLPYVECANPDQSETQVCIDKGIKSFPTWYFPDGTSSTGVNTVANIAKHTGCALPTST